MAVFRVRNQANNGWLIVAGNSISSATAPATDLFDGLIWEDTANSCFKIYLDAGWKELIVNGSVTDAKIGNRTVDQAIATASANTGTLNNILSWVAKQLHAITGKTNWFDTPDISLATTRTHVDSTVIHITSGERTAWNAKSTVTVPATPDGTITVDGTGRTVYTHPSANHIPASGSSGQILGWASAGTAQWVSHANHIPTAGASNNFLIFGGTSGTASWSAMTDTLHGTRGGGTQHAVATTSVAGFMSSTDKTKLDGVATGANNYTHPSLNHIPTGGSAGQILGWASGGTAQWESHGNHVPTTEVANNYRYLRNDNTWFTIPNSSTTVMGVVQLNDTLSSTSTSLGATANAVRQVMDYVYNSADVKLTRVATTANITLSSTQTIDGVAVIAGERVLVKDQSTGSQNGIYVVSAGAWNRATDHDSAEEINASKIAVTAGSTNANTTWACNNTTAITVGTTALTFVRSSIYDITGGASSIRNADLTASRALVSDGSGKVAVSSVTSIELGHLSGVTSAIQTQLNGKANTIHNLVDTTNHPVSGLTAGHVLRATGATAYAFGALQASDLPAHDHNTAYYTKAEVDTFIASARKYQ